MRDVYLYVLIAMSEDGSSRGIHCTVLFFFFFSSRRRHTRLQGDWSSDVCSSDLDQEFPPLHSSRRRCRARECRYAARQSLPEPWTFPPDRRRSRASSVSPPASHSSVRGVLHTHPQTSPSPCGFPRRQPFREICGRRPRSCRVNAGRISRRLVLLED